MTCYFHHRKAVFEKAGIVITKENKAEAYRIINEIVGVEYKNCPNAWSEVKRLIGEDEEAFASELQQMAEEKLSAFFVNKNNADC